MVVEQMVGTWCGLCPGAYPFMDSILANYDNVIPVAIHQGDPMAVPSGLELGEVFTGGGVPAFLLDRYKFDDYDFVTFGLNYPQVINHVEQRAAMDSPASLSFVDAKYDEEKDKFQLVVSTSFFAEYEGEVRMNMYIIEDKVTSSSVSYEQQNFFQFQEGHPYFQAGNPINDFEHQFVLRKMVGGPWGFPGSFSTDSFEEGDSFNSGWQIEIDPSWKLEQIRVVAIVQRADDDNIYGREIINAEQASLSYLIDLFTETTEPIDTTGNSTGINDINVPISNLKLSPNPVSDRSLLEFYLAKSGFYSISIVNELGQTVRMLRSEQGNEGLHSLQFNPSDLSSGIYFMHIETDSQRDTQRFFVQ
ncbi:Omp28-related outer membrane protein [Chitinophagales bacterium]|nr:Omp28-related outer membrane protein [Chitinophagales bacterium]